MTQKEFIEPSQLTEEQIAKALHKRQHEGRKQAKLFLRDCGIKDTTTLVDQLDDLATPEVRSHIDRLSKERAEKRKTIPLEAQANIVAMISEIRSAMDEMGVTQAELADRIGTQPPAISDNLSGKRLPGIERLTLIAQAMDKKWVLVDRD